MKTITRRPNGSKRVSTYNDQPSKTDPQFKDECDVNFIMKKFGKTGQITHLAKRQGQFADVSELPDLDQALNVVTKANEAFMELPAELRRRFGNSPSGFVNFLQDPKNDEEAVKLRLKVRRKAVEAPATENQSKPSKKQKNPPQPKSDDNNDE